MDKKTKVLIVDDEADFRGVMTLWFKSKGYSVISAADGMSAIEIIKNDTPDIVFLDLNMPVMDGTETVKRIREFNKNLPIVIISAYIDRLKIKDINEQNISGVFYKEEEFDKGMALIETVLRTHKGLKN